MTKQTVFVENGRMGSAEVSIGVTTMVLISLTSYPKSYVPVCQLMNKKGLLTTCYIYILKIQATITCTPNGKTHMILLARKLDCCMETSDLDQPEHPQSE